VDLQHGIFYRLAEGRRETNKRQSPVPIAPRLLAHLRWWKDGKIAIEFFVEWNGEPIKSVKTAFKSAVRLTGLDSKVTPHTLRHTAATWLMQAWRSSRGIQQETAAFATSSFRAPFRPGGSPSIERGHYLSC
jgi:integrase